MRPATRGDGGGRANRAPTVAASRPCPPVTHFPISVIGCVYWEDEPILDDRPGGAGPLPARTTARSASATPGPPRTHLPASIIGRFRGQDAVSNSCPESKVR
jgi:hypothetical protein